jgi:hypothetical protein
LYTINWIADTGPISRGPTSATAHSGRVTEITPIPKPLTTISTTKSGKYEIDRSSVEPYNMAASTSVPQPMINHRGAMAGAARVASTVPRPNAAANGRKATPARSAEYPITSCT